MVRRRLEMADRCRRPVAAALLDVRLDSFPSPAHAETPFDERVHQLALGHLQQP
jgi:hypothetical protein